jgi:hypothetical protein
MNMRTDVILDGRDYTIEFNFDWVEEEIHVNIVSVVDDLTGLDRWGEDEFIDRHADAIRAECVQFLNENY